jgi:hypothetical protein
VRTVRVCDLGEPTSRSESTINHPSSINHCLTPQRTFTSPSVIAPRRTRSKNDLPRTSSVFIRNKFWILDSGLS